MDVGTGTLYRPPGAPEASISMLVSIRHGLFEPGNGSCLNGEPSADRDGIAHGVLGDVEGIVGSYAPVCGYGISLVRIPSIDNLFRHLVCS